MEEGDKGEGGGGGEAYPLPTPSYIPNLTQTLVILSYGMPQKKYFPTQPKCTLFLRPCSSDYVNIACLALQGG